MPILLANHVFENCPFESNFMTSSPTPPPRDLVRVRRGHTNHAETIRQTVAPGVAAFHQMRLDELDKRRCDHIMIAQWLTITEVDDHVHR